MVRVSVRYDYQKYDFNNTSYLARRVFNASSMRISAIIRTRCAKTRVFNLDQ